MAQQDNRNNSHQQIVSSPSFPSMSSNQQQPDQSRQPTSYPSPTSYPDPSMSNNNQYNYPPPNGQSNESYRASPTGSNSSMSLPSMRSLDTLQQQQQQQHMGSPLPHQPVAQMGGQYYHNQGQTLPHPSFPNVTSDPNGVARYALPLTDNRIMSGGRHKKEIKRRTKTGCLTCRKRRIKCDEQHPACRNCQKSKRECLGYDPIFKQQPGPAAIQPAPSSAQSQGGLSATANSYGHQPHMIGAYGQQMAYDPALSAGSPGQPYDYASAIDPALEAATVGDSQYAQDLSARRNIEALLNMGGPPPPRQQKDMTQDSTAVDETKHLYYSIYAPGLENFLETKWYSVKGITKFLGDKGLMDLFGSLLHQFQQPNTEQPEILYTNSVEARVVWALASSVRSGAVEDSNANKSTGLVPSAEDPIEATYRLGVFEALLNGTTPNGNPLTQPIPGSTDHHRLRELEFWYTLANFCTLRDDGPTAVADIDNALAALRSLLDGRENRDVLYSIAVVRAIGQRVAEYTEADAPLHLDEGDNRSKLAVAKKFISDEASGNGTTNVIRRLCELVTRTWATSVPAPTAPPAAKADA